MFWLFNFFQENIIRVIYLCFQKKLDPATSTTIIPNKENVKVAPRRVSLSDKLLT